MARFLGRDLTALQQVYPRTGIGALLFLLFVVGTARTRSAIALWGRHGRLTLLRSFSATLLGASLFSFAVQHTSIGAATFLGALPSTILWAWLLFGVRPSRREIVAAVTAVAGAALIFQPTVGTGTALELLAQCAALASGFTVSFGMIASQLHGEPAIDNELNLLMMLSGASQCVLLSLALGEGLPNLTRWDTIFLTLVGAVLVPVCFSLVTIGFRLVKGSVAAVLLMLEIPLVIAGAIVLFGEWPSQMELLGGALVVSAALAVYTKTV
jgi:drug/metabolite transporter (DMT)-like permease